MPITYHLIICIAHYLQYLCLSSSSTIWCYTACLNSDWWGRSSASERGLILLAWRCSPASQPVLVFFPHLTFYSFCWVQITFPLLLDLRCRRMWSRTFLTRSLSLASSVHWSCRPGKDIGIKKQNIQNCRSHSYNVKVKCVLVTYGFSRCHFYDSTYRQVPSLRQWVLLKMTEANQFGPLCNIQGHVT